MSPILPRSNRTDFICPTSLSTFFTLATTMITTTTTTTLLLLISYWVDEEFGRVDHPRHSYGDDDDEYDGDYDGNDDESRHLEYDDDDEDTAKKTASSSHGPDNDDDDGIRHVGRDKDKEEDEIKDEGEVVVTVAMSSDHNNNNYDDDENDAQIDPDKELVSEPTPLSVKTSFLTKTDFQPLAWPFNSSQISNGSPISDKTSTDIPLKLDREKNKNFSHTNSTKSCKLLSLRSDKVTRPFWSRSKIWVRLSHWVLFQSFQIIWIYTCFAWKNVIK